MNSLGSNIEQDAVQSVLQNLTFVKASESINIIPKNEKKLSFTEILEPLSWNVANAIYPSIFDLNHTFPSTVKSLAMNKVEEWGWYSSSVPRWNDMQQKLVNYEVKYGIKSADMYSSYLDRSLVEVPPEELSDWVRTYRFYSL